MNNVIDDNNRMKYDGEYFSILSSDDKYKEEWMKNQQQPFSMLCMPGHTCFKKTCSYCHSVPPCDWSSWSIRIRILEYYLYYLLVVCSAGVYEKGYWRVYTHTKCGSTSPYFELHIIPTITIVEMIFSLSRLFYLSVEENGILQQQMEYNIISSHNILLYFISSLLLYYVLRMVFMISMMMCAFFYHLLFSSFRFLFSAHHLIILPYCY